MFRTAGDEVGNKLRFSERTPKGLTEEVLAGLVEIANTAFFASLDSDEGAAVRPRVVFHPSGIDGLIADKTSWPAIEADMQGLIWSVNRIERCRLTVEALTKISVAIPAGGFVLLVEENASCGLPAWQHNASRTSSEERSY